MGVPAWTSDMFCVMPAKYVEALVQSWVFKMNFPHEHPVHCIDVRPFWKAELKPAFSGASFSWRAAHSGREGCFPATVGIPEGIAILSEWQVRTVPIATETPLG